MCNNIKSILIGVSTGVVFGTLGIATGLGLPAVLVFGMMFAGIAELVFNTPEKLTNNYMQTDYE